MIKVLFSAPIPYRSLSVLIIPLLHILSAPSLECFPSAGGKLWKLNENRTYWVELSAPQITLIVQNSIWKFWELQIIWSKQKLDTFCNMQLCLVTNSAAKLVFENDKSYQGICLSLPSLLGLHFLHEYGAFGLSIPSVSEIQEKYVRMKIFKWTHCPVRLLFSFVPFSNIVCFCFALTIDAFWCYQIQWKKVKHGRANIFWNSYWRSLLNELSSYNLQSFGWWK